MGISHSKSLLAVVIGCMVAFTTIVAHGAGARFVPIVHHTDAEREWAYDRKSHIGMLAKAVAKGWTVVDMKKDWSIMYPFDQR
ncbi:MAG: hypothetical protein WBO24_18080 [Nitrospirales bacterium]